MAFTPEDGSGLATANSYVSVQEFKDHHGDRDIESANDGTWSDTQIQGAAVRATDYIDKRFGRRFRGYRKRNSQSLEWPRLDAYDDDDFVFPDLPNQLKKATSEYTLLTLQLGRDLAPVPDPGFPVVDPATGEVTNSSGPATRIKEIVGPIEDETEYGQSGSGRPMTSSGNLNQQIPEYPQADLWIEEIINSSRSRRLYRG